MHLVCFPSNAGRLNVFGGGKACVPALSLRVPRQAFLWDHQTGSVLPSTWYVPVSLWIFSLQHGEVLRACVCGR